MTTVVNSPYFKRFWSIAGAVSVRTKVLGIVVGTILLLGLFVTVQVRHSLTSILQDEIATQGLSITGHVAEIAASFVQNGDTNSLLIFLRETQAHYSDERHNTEIAYLFVADPEGRVIAQTAAPGDIQLPDLTAHSGHEHAHLSWIDAGDGQILDVAEPFPEAGSPEVVIRLGLADTKLRAAVSDVTRQLIYTLAVMTALGIGAALFLTWVITRPIDNLVKATQAVAEGDLSQHVSPWADDEIGHLAVSFNAMTEALALAASQQAERAELRTHFVQRVIAAQEDERRRIARELHDSTNQSLTSLLVGLRTLEESFTDEMLRQRTAELRRIAGETLNEVHGLAWQLRPSILDDMGLSAALERLTSDHQARYGTSTDLIIRGIRPNRLPSEVETAIYRIIQEALTNVARHARAQSVSVLLERHGENAVRIIVEDDGKGFDAGAIMKDAHQRLGLHGIRERAELLGGKLTIESQPGKGTSLFVEFPCCVESDVPDGADTTSDRQGDRGG